MEPLRGIGFELLLATFSNDSYIKGKQFEQLTKWWLTKDPIWSRKITTVWLWDEWPEYPGRDIGIDLVAQMTDGTLCAIQAKCFDENRDIPKSELDSFIAAASQTTFQRRLLVATTDGLSANARRMLKDQHVIRVMRSDLESSLSHWPTSIDDLVVKPEFFATPRPHQEQAISNVVSGLKTYPRGQLIMACGTGKTLTALWIKEVIRPKTTLVLVPSLNLLAQTLAEWAKNAKTKWQYLCVCSDDTVNKSDDQLISTVDELPFAVTTDASDIAQFLSIDGEKIIFSTYQSSQQVARAQQLSNTEFDLVICDEAHRLTGKTDADYSTVLNPTKILATKRLFMTATPRVFTSKAKAQANDRGVEMTSMDDEEIYGPVLHKLSFGEAIKQGLLSDYRVIIVGVTDPQVQSLIDQREIVSINDTVTTDAKTLAAHIGLAKATKDYGLKRTISFHSRVKSADRFASDHIKILDWLPPTHKPDGEIWTGTISGTMNTGERRKQLAQLRLEQLNRHALLTNARCLTEGIDVPTLDGVAFIDPRSSQIDIIQAVGRAIRKSDTKDLGTIVLPILVNSQVDTEEALRSTAFQPIWAVLNALRSHDDQLSTTLSAMRTNLGKTGLVGELPRHIVEDLPINIDSLLPDFINKFHLQILEHSTSVWDFWLGLLIDYVEKHGDSYVPASYTISTYRLGQWVNTQRTKYRNGLLEKDRIDRLEAVSGWTWSQLDEVWNSFFDLLSEYADEHGHSAPPNEPKQYNGKNLVSWVNTQRARYTKGKLESDRINRLEKLPGWTWTPKEDSWQTWFQLLESFALSHGHSQVPGSSLINGKPLGRWVSKQRARYRRGNLERDRVARLETLPGWSWSPDGDNWEMCLRVLKLFAAEHGHSQPTQEDLVNGIQIGSWVSHQRAQYKRNQLSMKKVIQLETLPNWSWDPLTDSWNAMFELLRSYTSIHGSATPPKSYEANGQKLGSWVSAQRTRFNRGRLESERSERLASLPGWSWDLESVRWERFFGLLKQYAEEFGSANPNQSYIKDDLKLGTWVNSQRSKQRKGNLEPEKAKRLEALPGWTWNPLNDAQRQAEHEWDENYSRLAQFLKQEQSASQQTLPADLRNWIKRQRTRYKNKTLQQQQIQKLEMLPDWSWNPHATSWDSFFALLKDYASEHGDALVPQEKNKKTLYKGQDLAAWVNSQRTNFKRGNLEESKILKLETVPGWSWDPRQETWDSYLLLLHEYANEFGHSRVPQGTAATPYRGRNLARWVNKQRSRYNSGKLELDRIQKLEAIPGWTWRVNQSRAHNRS